ncbi:MAG: DNA-processing protein DprA [Desulfobulbus oligotrophicus]|jgi:DNA processing protein|nr:DNA-processing protein DprA [Desulfobulbus oligotrophicus]
MHQDVEDWLTLSFLPGLGCTLINYLVEQLGTPGDVFSRPDQVASLPRYGTRLSTLLNSKKQLRAARTRAQEELELIAKADVQLLVPPSPQYPAALYAFPDRPVLLYCRGNIDVLQQRSVAVVGSRNATDYGRRVAMKLAGDLASAGLTVVSGAAYGIDAAAHHSALAATGATVAVLGCGLDVVYPRAHADLFGKISAQGLLLSEYPLGTQPEGFRFPARNRIISGLVEGVVVVEATEKSGSLITARLALDQGKEVFAVPGRIDSPRSAGTHRLIQQGAHLVHTVDDILLGLSWNQHSGTPRSNEPAEEDDHAGNALTAQEQAVLAKIDTYPRDIETIADLTGLSFAELHGLLLQLELKGLVRQLAGQQYESLEYTND